MNTLRNRGFWAVQQKTNADGPCLILLIIAIINIDNHNAAWVINSARLCLDYACRNTVEKDFGLGLAIRWNTVDNTNTEGNRLSQLLRCA